MNFTLTNEEIQLYNDAPSPTFPKYASQIINLANQNAQGTRPKTVGQLSELFPEFVGTVDEISVENWETWYAEKYPDAMEAATEKIYAQVENLHGAMRLITKEMVREWVKDLIITKTYNGLYVQKAILERLSAIKGEPYRLARPEEEAQGIDGYIGAVAYSVKPDSYQVMGRLPETIGVKMIRYSKTKTGLKIEAEE